MENLKEKTAKGIAWGAINNGATQVLNLVFGIFLARLLSADDYGILALITVFTLLAGCIQAAGFSQALANLKTPTRRDYNAVAWFNILAGFSIYGILFLGAPVIAWFFEEPLLTDVSRLAFLTIPISAVGIVPNAKLWIELRNRELAVAAIIALVVSGSCGVWLAWNGWSYWSLAWQQVIYIVVATLIKYYYTRWMPTLPVDFSPIKQMFGFSSKMLITNMLTVVSQNVLTFIFGKLLPISTLGLFTQANKWNTMGSSFVSNTMTQVAQPVLASINEEENRQERVFRKMLRFTSFTTFPLMFGLALVAHEFILLTVGPTWKDCVPLLQILCIGGSFLPLHVLYQNYIISCGRSDLYLRIVVVQIILQVAITLGLSAFGVTAMVSAFSLFNICMVLVWHYTLRRVHPLSTMEAFKDILPFAMIAALCMIAVHFLTLWTESFWLLLMLRFALATILYLGVMKLLHVKTFEECLTFMKKRCL